MRVRLHGVLTGLALLLPSASADPDRAEPDALAVGEPFPVIQLPLCGSRDDSLSIESLRGRKLMLHLFASW